MHEHLKVRLLTPYLSSKLRLLRQMGHPSRNQSLWQQNGLLPKVSVAMELRRSSFSIYLPYYYFQFR